MATYSQTATGYVVGGFNLPTTKIYNIPDLSASGIQTGIAGGQALAMQTRDRMLVKGPDGGLHWYELDAERSTPANPVLRYTGP